MTAFLTIKVWYEEDTLDGRRELAERILYDLAKRAVGEGLLSDDEGKLTVSEWNTDVFIQP